MKTLPPNTTLIFDPNEGFTAKTPTDTGFRLQAITDTDAFAYMRECGSLHTADAVSNRAAFDTYFAALIHNSERFAEKITNEQFTDLARIASQIVTLRNTLYPL
jgi:hypothetical protein